jgi:hypothetical protein
MSREFDDIHALLIVGWVQRTGITPITVGCTHPTNTQPLARLLRSRGLNGRELAASRFLVRVFKDPIPSA